MPAILAEEGQGHTPLASIKRQYMLKGAEGVHKFMIHHNAHLDFGMIPKVIPDIH